jgi:hypothetical protein
MVRVARTPIALVLVFGACVRSQAVQCGDLLCPEDRVCSKGSCVSPSLAAACSGKSEGDICNLSELGNGTCHDGLCITGRCGDGMVNGVEACDGANLAGKSCLDFNNSTDAAGLACTPDCSFDTSACNGRCGDGHKGTEEECDRNDFGGLTCTDFSPPDSTSKFYPGGAATCMPDCKLNLGGCTGGWCGDKMRQRSDQFGEDCDGDDFGVPRETFCASQNHPGDATPPGCDQMTCTFTEDTCSCGPNGVCPPATPICVKEAEDTYSCH